MRSTNKDTANQFSSPVDWARVHFVPWSQLRTAIDAPSRVSERFPSFKPPTFVHMLRVACMSYQMASYWKRSPYVIRPALHHCAPNQAHAHHKPTHSRTIRKRARLLCVAQSPVITTRRRLGTTVLGQLGFSFREILRA